MSGLPQIVRSLETATSSSNENNAASTADAHKPTPTNCLVVHFDINETVLVGDDAGGDTRQDSLNKILAKSAFVKVNSKTLPGKAMEDSDPVVPTHWWDGSEIQACGDSNNHVVPLYTGWHWPPGCCPYYRTAFKSKAKRFVENDGRMYKPLYEELQRLVAPVSDHADMHLIPALFDTIQTLHSRSAQNVRFVFRTFGSDLPQVAQAVAAFCKGQHPDHPAFALSPGVERLFRGRWRDGTYILVDYNDPNDVVARGDTEILAVLARYTICGIQDDYDFWAANGWEPWAGKPVWSGCENGDHHVLLDDNIHNTEHDSIASVRRRRKSDDSNEYEFLTGREIQDLQGLHLIRVPTIEPILNRQWFVQQLDQAQARFSSTHHTS